MPFTMKDIETSMNQLAAENADLRREVGELREAMQDIRDALDHLPPPSKPIDEAALSAKLTAVIDGKITQATTDITASVKKATKRPKISLENGNLAAFLAGPSVFHHHAVYRHPYKQHQRHRRRNRQDFVESELCRNS